MGTGRDPNPSSAGANNPAQPSAKVGRSAAPRRSAACGRHGPTVLRGHSAMAPSEKMIFDGKSRDDYDVVVAEQDGPGGSSARIRLVQNSLTRGMGPTG